MRRNTKQSENDDRPLSIRSGVWLSLLGVALGIVALSLSRTGAIKDPTELSFQVASAKQHSSIAKFKRPGEPAASFSHASREHADETDAIDFSIINDRSHWVDPAWLP